MSAASPALPVASFSSSLAEPGFAAGAALLGGDPAPAAAAAESPIPNPSAIMLPPRPLRRPRGLSELDGQDRVRPFHSVAFGANVSTLGAGLELAIPVQSHLNVRVGAAYLNWNGSFQSDGMAINPTARFTSGRATLDWFPRRKAFHISAGTLLLHSHLVASTGVAPGARFSLNDDTYTSSTSDPVAGSATMHYQSRTAPLLLLGFGNMLPRSGKHLSMPFELGAAYVKPPTLNMQLGGTACNASGCSKIATDADTQANLDAELKDARSDLRMLRVYPIVSLGFAVRF